MLKFCSLLIGEDPKNTANFQASSKRQIILYANCLLIPVILWFINSFLLVRNVLEGSFIVALITAFIAGFIIFILERAIIMSNGSKPIFWFRIVLGFAIALLGSICLDEVIFKNDIDNQMFVFKQAEIDNAAHKAEEQFNNQIATQQALVDQKTAIWTQSLNDAKSEADGTGGSKQKKVGKIAQLKMDIASKHENDYNIESQKLEELKNNSTNEIEKAKSEAEASFNENGLLLRIHALFELIKKDKLMLGVYVLFTLFLFCLEFLVVLIKIDSKKTVDMEIEGVKDSLLRTKAGKILEKRHLYYNPEQYIPSVKNANNFLKQNNTSIFN